MAIEIVDFPIKNGGSFHGKMLVHQRVPENTCFQLPDVAKQSPQCRVSHDVWHSPCLWLLVGAGFIHHDRHDLSMDCSAWKKQNASKSHGSHD